MAEEEIKMLKVETLFMLVNAVSYKYGPRFCLYEYGPSMAAKMAKLHLKVFLRNFLIIRTKVENFGGLIIKKMSWLATWFILIW